MGDPTVEDIEYVIRTKNGYHSIGNDILKEIAKLFGEELLIEYVSYGDDVLGGLEYNGPNGLLTRGIELPTKIFECLCLREYTKRPYNNRVKELRRNVKAYACLDPTKNDEYSQATRHRIIAAHEENVYFRERRRTRSELQQQAAAHTEGEGVSASHSAAAVEQTEADERAGGSKRKNQNRKKCRTKCRRNYSAKKTKNKKNKKTKTSRCYY